MEVSLFEEKHFFVLSRLGFSFDVFLPPEIWDTIRFSFLPLGGATAATVTAARMQEFLAPAPPQPNPTCRGS